MISSLLSNERNMNYGLDRLSIEILNKKLKENRQIIEEKKSNIPEADLIKKLARFSKKDFYFRWSVLIFICNIYNFASAPYILASANSPSGIWLIFELLSECVLICDLLGRLFLTKTMKFTSFWHLNETLGPMKSFFYIFSSFPCTFVSLVVSIDLKNIEFATINCLKLLRFFQVGHFLSKLEISLNHGKIFQEICGFSLILFFSIHYFGCFWMFVDRLENISGVAKWTEKLNRNNSLQIYVESLLWAAESMTGIVIHTSFSYTEPEIIASIVVMLVSSIISGVLYSKFIVSMDAVNSQVVETQEKLKKILEWGKQINLSSEILVKIKIYFTVAQKRFDYLLNFDFIQELPFSLRSELCLCVFQDLIEKVKFFSLGDPSFIVSFMRHLKPRLYMKGDNIIRQGEHADEFFIVRYGTAEVLASDGFTQIALMDPGSFFGEIGIVLNTLRTVTVRAYSAVIVCCIHRSDFVPILDEFPEFSQYLKKVAKQRAKSVNPEDIDINYDLLDESISSDESDEEGELERPKIFTEAEHSKKPFIKKLMTVPFSNAPSDYLVIDPLSWFYYFWACLLLASYGFYLVYVPFAIAFETNGGVWSIGLNVLCYFVYAVDIFVNINTSVMTEYRVYYHKKDYILKYYIMDFLYSDIISLIPLDLFFIFIPSSQYISAYLRVFRLFKYPRVKSIMNQIMNETGTVFNTLFLVFSLFYIISHYLACLYLYSAKVQHWHFDVDSSDDSQINEYENLANLTAKSASDQYMSMIYWSTGILSTSGYSNLFALSTFNKLFSAFILTLSHLFTLFLYAVSTKVAYMLNIHYVNYIGKTQVLEVWMANKRFSEQLKKKVNDYYLLLWKKSSGFHKDFILKDLPKVLKQEILNYLFASVTESGIFPDQLAPLTDLVNHCRVEYYCAEEVIISQGELVLDTYFVIEGCVKVSNSSSLLSQKLFRGCSFCEEFLTKEQFGLCPSTFIAETDLRLAVLSVLDFRGIIQNYPEFGFEVSKGITERNGKADSRLDFVTKEKTFTSLNDTNLNISTELNKSLELSPTLHEVHVRNSNFSCKRLREKVFNGIYLIVLVWNAFYVPYYIGTFTKMTEVGIFFEGLTLIVYYFSAFSTILKKKQENQSLSSLSLKKFDSKIIFHLVAGFPVLIISDLTSRSEMFLVIYGFFRLLNVYFIPKVINKLTRYYISWYITFRLALMILFYIYSVHITACFFILVGRQNPSKSWFTLIDPDSNYQKYVFAAYWASTTLSHTSFGDTQLHTNSEKTFAIFAFFMGWIIYCLIFGTICSILLGFSSKLKTNLQSSYEYVKNVLKKKKVFKFYSKEVESFYNYHWESNKGINEKELFEEMNKGLRVSLQVFIYSKAIIKSQIFKESRGELDMPLTRSIFSLMRLEYYSIGESLIKVGDRSQNMFILLEGQVDVLNLKGTKVLATLKQGSHFGEANIILKNDMRTASILATQICTVGILEKEMLEILFEAFPYWYTMLEAVVKERMEKTFNSSKISDVNRHCQTIFEKIFSSPKRMSRYTIRSEKLIAEKVADIELRHTENQWYSLYLVHFIFLIYSAITIPLFIGFYFDRSWVAISIEALVVVESLVFLFKNTNFKILLPENRRFNWSGLVKYYYHNHVFQDLAAVSPFHLVYMLFNQRYKASLVPLSLIRLLALFRLPSILEIVEFSNRKKIWFVNLFKVAFTIFFIIHSSTCLWHFCVQFESPSPWIEYYKLPESLQGQYRSSIFYVVNIITSTGFNNTSPRSTIERLVSLIISINGIAFFAILYGYISSTYSKKHPELFKMIKKIKSSLRATSHSGIPELLKSRIQEFYTFSAYIEKRIGGVTMDSLYSHLPSKLVKSIIFKCNKYMLKKLPILASINTIELIERLSLHLEPLVFLTDDFIIYKNDKGNEMYFIMIGSVNILAQDNQKVLKTLKKGEFFGELALVNDTTRMCSVVASKPSLIYSLKKEVFLTVIENYPDLFQNLKKEGDKRKTENTLIKNNQNDSQSLKNSMFSAISRTFFARQQTCRMVQLMTGMKHFSPNVVINCLDTETKSKIHTRRPQVQSEGKRRASQENILNDFNYF